VRNRDARCLAEGKIYVCFQVRNIQLVNIEFYSFISSFPSFTFKINLIDIYITDDMMMLVVIVVDGCVCDIPWIEGCGTLTPR